MLRKSKAFKFSIYHMGLGQPITVEQVIQYGRGSWLRIVILIHGYGKTIGNSKSKDHMRGCLENSAKKHRIAWMAGENFRGQDP